MTYVPSLRESLQQTAERRYGRRRRDARWSAFALAPAAVAAVIAAAIVAPDVERERTLEPAAAEVHTVKVTELPPRPRARFRIVDPKPLSRAEGLAAMAAAHADIGGDDEGELIRAYAVPGIKGAGVLLTRRSDGWRCVEVVEPPAGDDPGKWTGTCSPAEEGTSHVAGDTFAGVVGPETGKPAYVPPHGRSTRLRPNTDGVVVVQGAPNESGVRWTGGVVEGITIGRDARHHCSDGTSVDLRVDRDTPDWDPCKR